MEISRERALADILVALPTEEWCKLFVLFDGFAFAPSVDRDRCIREYRAAALGHLGDRPASREIARLLNRIAAGGRHGMPTKLIEAVKLNRGETLKAERIRPIIAAVPTSKLVPGAMNHAGRDDEQMED